MARSEIALCSTSIESLGQAVINHSLSSVYVLPCRVVTYALGRHLPAGSTVSRHADCLDSVLQSKHAEANAQIQASR